MVVCLSCGTNKDSLFTGLFLQYSKETSVGSRFSTQKLAAPPGSRRGEAAGYFRRGSVGAGCLGRLDH